MQDTSYSWKKAARNKRTVFITMLQLGEKRKKQKQLRSLLTLFQVLCYLLHFFFQNSCIEREFAYHKFTCLTYTIQWFVVYSQLSNHHHDRTQEHFHCPPKKPCTISSQYPFSPSPQPQATTNLLSVSMVLPVLDISHHLHFSENLTEEITIIHLNSDFPGAQTVKHLPIVQETHVQSLGREDLLEKEMATHSSILAWKIPWMEEPGRLQSMGSQKVGHD